MEFKTLTINDVCEVVDCLHKTAPVVDYPTKYRMLRTSNIRNGKIDSEGTRSVSEETYKKWTVRGPLTKGDVLLTREAPMGEVAIIRNEKYYFFLGQRMLQLKPYRDLISPDYLYYSLQTRELQHQIMMNEGTGSVVSNIRIPLLKKMDIMVPEINMQNKVTNILRSIDLKMEANNQIISNLEELAQTLFKRWFVDFEFPNENGEPYKSSGGKMVESELGLIPKDWDIGQAKDIFDFSPKTTLKKGSNTKFVEMKNLIGSYAIPYWRYREFSGSGSKFIQGDTLLARITPCLENGKIGFVDFLKDDEVGWGSTEFITIRNKLNEFSHISFFFAKQQDFFNYAVKNMTGSSGRQRISAKVLGNYKMAVPQEDIFNEFGKSTLSIANKITLLNKETKILTELRDTLLPKLLSGEVEIPDDSEVNDDVPVS